MAELRRNDAISCIAVLYDSDSVKISLCAAAGKILAACRVKLQCGTPRNIEALIAMCSNKSELLHCAPFLCVGDVNKDMIKSKNRREFLLF